MATRTSFAGSVSVNDLIQSSDPNNLPGGLIGYRLVQSNQTGLTTAADLTNLTLTLTPQASRILRISWMVQFQDSAAQGTTETIRMYVLKDGSVIAQYDYVSNPGAGTNNFTCAGWTLDGAPSNTSHVYKLQAGRSGTATGTFDLIASSTSPARFTIHDDGPNF